MINQTASEAVFCAAYVENYLDCVENLPDDIQRHLSRLHELDISYRGYLKDIEQFRDNLERDEWEASQRKTLYKLEQVLISLQEVGDEKVEIGQQILDLIDNKYRQLDIDLRNLDVNKEQENFDSNHKESQVREPAPVSTSASSAAAAPSGGGPGGNGGGGSGAGGGGGSGGGSERAAKRVRRGRGEAEGGGGGEGPAPEPAPSAPVSRSSAGGNSQGKKQAGAASAAGGGKKKKRKSRNQSGQGQSSRDGGTPPKEEEVQHDVDEPTYCLCDQISYGEMILCDNDLCPIEWFHFVCVSLTTKPKGKWFCPKCRGDRPNVMKPKSQFLKELQQYNKEKEEKA